MPTLRSLPDAAFAGPSLLPGWSRAHVATHIARNADSHVRLLEAASDDRLVEQYPGGKEGRAAEIERGVSRAPEEIVEDVERSGKHLFEVWGALAPDVWLNKVRTNRGDMEAWRTAWSRWREIEIHHVDLAAGFGPDEWPQRFVDALFPQVLDGLSHRLPEGARVRLDDGYQPVEAGSGTGVVTIEGTKSALLAWMVGRDEAARILITDPPGASPPDLAPW